MRKSALLFLILTFIIFLPLNALRLAFAQSNYTIAINELMPNPVGLDSDFEWVELYNYGIYEINLNGWKLDSKLISKDIIIQPSEFIIFARNVNKFSHEFQFAGQIFELAFSLNNGGENLILENSIEQIVDSFEYGQSTEGKSFERAGITSDCLENIIEPTLANHTAGEINESYIPECWPYFESYVLDAKLLVNNIEYTNPMIIISEANIGISFDLETDAPIVTSLEYYLNEEQKNLIDLNNGIYGEDLEIVINYETGTSESVYFNNIFIIPDIRINEFLPNPQGIDKGFEWVELKNFSGLIADIDKIKIYINDVKINNFLATEFSCEGKIVDGGELCTFDFIDELLENEGNGISPLGKIDLKIEDFIIDSISYFLTEDGNSYSLQNGEWTISNIQTYGKENDFVYPEPDPTIYFTEIYPSPKSGEKEWIEIFNYGNFELDISNWYFSEESPNSNTCVATSKKLNKVVQPNSHEVFTSDAFDVSLNNSGDTIYLCDKSNNVIDEITYSEIISGISYARFVEDGKYVNNFKITELVTPNELNRFYSDLPEIIKLKASTDNKNFIDLNSLNYADKYYLDYELSFPIDVLAAEYFLSDNEEIEMPLAASELYAQKEKIIKLKLTLSDGRIIEFKTEELEIDLPAKLPILITEIYASPSSGEEEWIEVYNLSNEEILLEDWYFSEDKNGEFCKPNSQKFSSGLGAIDYFAVEDHGISLNNSGDEILLCDEFNRIIDEVNYPELTKGVSFARTISNDEYTNTFDFSLSPTPRKLNLFPKEAVKNSSSSVKKESSVKAVSKNINQTTASSFEETDQFVDLPALRINEAVKSRVVSSENILTQYPIWIAFFLLALFALLMLMIYIFKIINTINIFTNLKQDLLSKKKERYFVENR